MATTELTHTVESTGPHIPLPKGEAILDWSIGSIHITNTILSTWLFMGVMSLIIFLFYRAITSDRHPRMKALGLDIVERILIYTASLLGSESAARKYLWLLGGIMIMIFLGNLFGLILDFLVLISAHEWLSIYLRPIHADLASTLVFSLTVILLAQITAIWLRGPLKHLKHYLFHYHGDSIAERIVSVFIGWLHFAGEFIRIGSLSMRLFLNIFVGAILIAVVVYVGELIPAFHTGAFRVLALPFWFFELLVAFLQAYIFMTLSSLYIRESLPDNH